jgi:hypothetical protein
MASVLRETIPLPSLTRGTSATLAVVNRRPEAIPVRLELVASDGVPLGGGEKRTIPPESRLTLRLERLVPELVRSQGSLAVAVEGAVAVEVSHFGGPGQITAWLVLAQEEDDQDALDVPPAPFPLSRTAGLPSE